MQSNSDLKKLSKEEIRRALKEFLLLLSKSAYFEAHELLEELWRVERKDKTTQNLLLKALINASVSLHHTSKANLSGAAKCKQTYLKYKPLMDNYEDRELFEDAFNECDKLLICF